MRYDETASHKLYWAIIVGMVVATIMVLTQGCAHKKVLMLNCEKTNSEVPKGELHICDEY